jgi:hypothetical protein
MLYDIEEILKYKPFETNVSDHELEKLSKKMFFTQRITNSDDILNKYNKEKILKDFDFVSNYMNIITNFSYISPITQL